MAAGYVLTDDFLEIEVAAVSNGTAFDPTTCELHLFTNNVTIDDSFQDASGLTEATFDGYAPAALDLSGFSGPVVTGHVATVTAPAPIEFDAGAGGPTETIYGYWVEDTSGAMLWAESFAAGQAVAPLGIYKITPSLKQKTCR